MSAYVVIDLDVEDRPALEEYGRAVPSIVAKYEGRYLVRGGQIEVLEGDWKPKRLIVYEFPTTDAARRWHESEEYRPFRATRQRAAHANIVLVEGV